MKNLKLPHIWIIAKYHMRFSLRNGAGIVFLLLALSSALLVASLFISPVEAVLENMGGEELSIGTADLIEDISKSEQAVGAVNWLVSGDQGEYLLRDKPALLSCVMLVFIMLLPFLVCFGAFNQTSGDIANKGLRFLLLRTERVNIYFGRFLGTVLFCLSSIVVSMSLVVIYLQLKLNLYVGVEIWLWSLQGSIAYFMMCLPFVAMCAWISSSIDSPFGSLVLCLLLVGFPALILYVVGNMYPNLEFLNKLWPTGWKYGMMNSSFGYVMLTALVLSAFTSLFLCLGLRNFQNRDL